MRPFSHHGLPAVSLLLLVLVRSFCHTAYGVELFGSGSPNAVSIFQAWSEDYQFSRDDVSVTYSGVGTDVALNSYNLGDTDFTCLDRGITDEFDGQYDYLLQVPLAGQAMLMAYNIPALGPSDPNLVLDRETLGAIWAGTITKWNDTRIKALNGPIASKLPGENILLGYNDNSVLTVVEVLKRALSSFSVEFADALAAANRSLDRMPPATAIPRRAFVAGASGVLRTQWLQNNTNALTYLYLTDVPTLPAGLRVTDMINKAGTKVKPTSASIQAAMSDFSYALDEGNFGVEIYDGNGTDTWPIAFLSYISVAKSISAVDCTNSQEVLNLMAWAQTNDAASRSLVARGYGPLDTSIRKLVIDKLSTVRCNGEQAYTTSYLIGAGPPLPVYTSWTVARTSGTTKLKFFESEPTPAKQLLVTYQEDFGATSNGLSATWYNRMPDVALMPMVAYAIVPGYNIPELDGKTLVLDWETIALIYLSNITMWNDERIKALNTEDVANALPNEPILVVTQSIASATTQIFTAALSSQVPEYSDRVGRGSLVTFPVQNDTARSLVTDQATGVIKLLQANQYSFAFWQFYEILSVRTLGAAAMVNSLGHAVIPSTESIESALEDYTLTGDLTYTNLSFAPGNNSWPLAAFGSFFYRSQTMEDCAKARALASFLYWSQTNAVAKQIANRQGFILATSAEIIERQFLLQLKQFTCDGVAVSTVYGCVDDIGVLCSDAGVCTNNRCVCDTGRNGKHCENFISESSSDSTAIALGVTIPVAALVVCGLLALMLVLLVIIKRRSDKSDDWEIAYDELEVGEQLGAGGYGAVHKATWKGTEVAVKVMASEKITKDMEKSFKDEVRVMTSLRHPNVVLFMAASTKAPKMCIVMEYMALGSLYDLLHNELIPDIPFALKAKMAYQASKGMHFLHSSGIVHRDLKSLNLLLDSKWNVKVSDFGLTKFKEDVGGTKAGKDIGGSIHWTAPEVLNETPDVDLILADVYSFGIILWELLTREQPYLGLSPAAVAVAVIRDGIRPTMPDVPGSCPQEYEELISSCWHHDPTIRPTFLEIMTRLSSMHGDSTSAGATSFTSKTSSSSGNSGPDAHGIPRNIYGSWTMPSTNSSSTGDGTSSSSNSSKNLSAAQAAAAGGLRAPEGEVAIVFTDITRAASLWEFNAAAMRDSTLLHNEALRSALKRHRGYEVVFIRDRNSGEGSFCMAFQHASDALAWCCDVQQALLNVEWPEALLDHPGAAEEWGDTDDRVLYKGLRVRMGVHMGTPKVVRDPMTRRVEYIGPVVNAAARITAMTHGGQIVLSHAVHAKVRDTAEATLKRVVNLGKFEMPDAPAGAKLYELKVEGLEGRFFGGVTKDGDAATSATPTSGSDGAGKTLEPNEMSGASTASSDGGHGRGGGRHGGGGELQTAVGEGMMFKEDTFLTSANLCRWIIDFGEIQVGKQVGLGSYGVVYRGKWKGVEVAVKRFIKQKLDERRMLEFRAEMAFLSELHHPNIVLFIGACVKKPNLCIVTEFMKQGSLKDILANNAVKLAWKQKLRLLRSTALGINYLHSLHPVIVHRDLKPSNLLVDENWNVKVADFGFARIKEENATMTRCGTPCWTAPEILRGEKYDERADVFSFGIIMWQVATRKEPYAGRNFMGVSLDVLEGKRPQIPNDCPAEFKKVMKKCWHASPDKRPKMEDILTFLDQQVGDDADGLPIAV